MIPGTAACHPGLGRVTVVGPVYLHAPVELYVGPASLTGDRWREMAKGRNAAEVVDVVTNGGGVVSAVRVADLTIEAP